MKTLAQQILKFLSLSFGAGCVLFMIVNFAVNERLMYWATKQEAPNMDPRVTYILALFAFVASAFAAGLVELIRAWVYERRPLKAWQLIIVGASYPLYFSSLAFRHVFSLQTAEYMAIALALIVNPLTVYYAFNGYSEQTQAA